MIDVKPVHGEQDVENFVVHNATGTEQVQGHFKIFRLCISPVIVIAKVLAQIDITILEYVGLEIDLAPNRCWEREDGPVVRATPPEKTTEPCLWKGSRKGSSGFCWPWLSWKNAADRFNMAACRLKIFAEPSLNHSKCLP